MSQTRNLNLGGVAAPAEPTLVVRSGSRPVGLGNLGEVGGVGRRRGRRGRGSLGLVLEVLGDGQEIAAVLDVSFWRAPTPSPLRLVWTAQR